MISPTATSSETSAAALGDRTPAFYRHDLDGLRGIAIALVAVFHIWFGRVSGGVDVFLALSGFFFGGKVLRAALNPEQPLSRRPRGVGRSDRFLPPWLACLPASRW